MKNCMVLLCGLVLLLVGGCGSGQSAPVAKLEGSVTVAGKPLPADAEGNLVFMPAAAGEARPVQAAISGGHYRAEKVPVGKVQVTFHITRKTGKILKASPNDPHTSEERVSLVPQASQAGVPLDVKGDNLQQNFDLK